MLRARTKIARATRHCRTTTSGGLVAFLCISTLALVADCGVALAEAPPTPIPAGDITAFGPTEGSGIAFGPEEGLWYAGDEQIDRIDLAGVLTGEFKIPTGEEPYEPLFAEPSKLVAGTEDHLWYVDYGTNNQDDEFIGRISTVGTMQEFPVDMWLEFIAPGAGGKTWYDGTSKTAPYESVLGRIDGLGKTETITVAGDFAGGSLVSGAGETVWAGRGSAILRIRLDGSAEEVGLPSGDSPSMLVADGEGGVWFTAPPESIGHVTARGALSMLHVPNQSGDMGGIAVGPDGNIWVGEGAGLLARVAPSGTVTTFSRLAPGGYIDELKAGPDGNLWYTTSSDGELLRLITPIAPVPTSAPQVTGESLEGYPMSTSNGGWENEASSFAYQWQSCDDSGTNCIDVPAGNSQSIVLSASDLGRRMRAVVTATGVGGSGSTASDLSLPVQAPPQQPAEPRINTPRPIPTVHALIDWGFGRRGARTRVRLLNIRHLPSGAQVDVWCHGKGCPFAHLKVPPGSGVPRMKCDNHHLCHGGGDADSEVRLAGLFGEHRLTPGVRLRLTVTHAGWIGEAFYFVSRARHGPTYTTGCLAQDSTGTSMTC
jgi:hypothetical protein